LGESYAVGTASVYDVEQMLAWQVAEAHEEFIKPRFAGESKSPFARFLS
jgi:hypothetical protein